MNDDMNLIILGFCSCSCLLVCLSIEFALQHYLTQSAAKYCKLKNNSNRFKKYKSKLIEDEQTITNNNKYLQTSDTRRINLAQQKKTKVSTFQQISKVNMQTVQNSIKSKSTESKRQGGTAFEIMFGSKRAWHVRTLTQLSVEVKHKFKEKHAKKCKRTNK